MRKGITLLTVLLLPITIYLIFAISVIHYVPVPHYGPRTPRVTIVDGHKQTDTIYHTVGSFEYRSKQGLIKSDTLRGRMYVAIFINADSAKNGFNCGALKAYVNFNKVDLDTMHYVFFCRLPADPSFTLPQMADSLKLNPRHCYTFYVDSNDLEFLRHDNYFPITPLFKKQGWKSDADVVLIDTKGCVRGYYDGRFAPEVTRMIEDIKHIKFHDEAAGMEKKYTPVKKGSPAPSSR
jgi:hypothetical protein